MVNKVIHMFMHRCGIRLGITANFRCITCVSLVDIRKENVDNFYRTFRLWITTHVIHIFPLPYPQSINASTMWKTKECGTYPHYPQPL